MKWRTISGWAGLAAFGLFLVIGFVFMLGHRHRQIVEPPVLTSAVVVAPLIAVALHRTARTFKGGARQGAMAGVLLVGILTWAVVLFGWLHWINATFDDSAPSEHRAQVRSQQRSKGQTTLHVDSWHADGDGQAVHVTNTIAERRPSFVIVTTREGALGFEWIFKVDVAR